MRLFLFIVFILLFPLNSFGQADTAKIIQKKILIGNNELDENLTGYDAHFEVISFSVTTTINGYCYVVKNIGPKFSESTIRLIKKAKRGRRVYFEDIKVRGIDGKTIRMKPLIFKIR